MVQIYANKCPISFNFNDLQFEYLRRYIAMKYNDHFGALYIEYYFQILMNNDTTDYQDKMVQFVLEDPMRAKNFDIYAFLFNSKKNFKVSNMTCKKIYDLIGEYDALTICIHLPMFMGDKKSRFDDFKNLLLYCYEHRCKLQIKME